MSRTGRSMIRSVLKAKDLESFVDTYKIPRRFSPTLPGPDDSADCTPDMIVLYTLAFSSRGVRYPLSSFKINLLRHFGVHFSQLYPLGFMRVVHFELSCVAVSNFRDVKFVVEDKVEPGLNRNVEMKVTGGSVQTGGSADVEGDEGASSDGEESSPNSLHAKDSSPDDKEDLESRLARKRKAASPKQVPAPRGIRLRLRSASGQKAPPVAKAVSELPPTGVKGSLSKHLRFSSFVSEPLLVSPLFICCLRFALFWQISDVLFPFFV
ncbi:hypothetical protein HanHA300_Chr15g0551761 [Helianthus annuus]|nr:hypothetical protein HanHA300_Chr15g0551761 [Helianthus annuus]